MGIIGDDFPLVSAEDIPGCGEYTIPAGCEDQVAKKAGIIEHARAEEADMRNFNTFLWSEHWENDYRDNSTTPDSHPDDEGHGSGTTEEAPIVIENDEISVVVPETQTEDETETLPETHHGGYDDVMPDNTANHT